MCLATAGVGWVLCGRLPLALRIAAAWLTAHPAWSLAHLISRLRAHSPAGFEAGQHSVAAALDLSYQQLSHQAQRTYRLLGLHPGPDFDVYAAAALMDATLTEASRLLDCLIENHLLQEPTPNRYRFHDLVGAHAARLGTTACTEADRYGALDRLLGHYADCVTAAMAQLYQPQNNGRDRRTPSKTPRPTLDSPTQASGWLDAELPNLLATANCAAGYGRHDHVQYLSDTLGRRLRVRGHHRDAETLHRLALRIARATSDSDAELRALVELGQVCRVQAKYEAATDHLEKALEIARAKGDLVAEADALAGLARTHRMQGRYDQAATYFDLVLQAAGASDNRDWELEARLGLGWIDRLQRRYDEAAAHLEQAQAIARAIGNHRAEADATNALGIIHRLQGRYANAIGHFELAKQISQAIGNQAAELIATFGIGSALQQQGNYEHAICHMQQALAQAQAISNRNWQFEAIHGLGRIYRAASNAGRAVDCHRQALELAADLNQPTDLARAHCGLAYAYEALGQPELAQPQWRQALEHLTSLGVDETEDEETTTAAIRAHLSPLNRTYLMSDT